MNPTLDWVSRAQKPSGGISAWRTTEGWGPEYPEITGYFIPTLLKYGEIEMATRAADWLCSVQFENGMFPNLHGLPAVFDTGAATEGLKAIHGLTLEKKYKKGLVLAKSQLRPRLLAYKYKSEPPVLARGQGGMGMAPDAAMEWDTKHWFGYVRSHYLAYWLEGLYRMGVPSATILSHHMEGLVLSDEELIQYEYARGWVPLKRIGGDICATLQFSWLLSLLFHDTDAEGMQAQIPNRLFDTASHYVQEDGGVPLSPSHPDKSYSWGAKYYLDAAFALKGRHAFAP